MAVIGIDPGESGAIAHIDDDGEATFIKLKDATERDAWEWLCEHRADFAFIEAVHSMPKQGVSSSFKFGKSYGYLRGILIASGIPFQEVTPQAWQKAMQCRTGGNKNISKARAQQLFPGLKIIHANADALLIAMFCRRQNDG